MDELLRKVLEETRRLTHPGTQAEYEELEQLVELRQLLTDAVENKGQLDQQEKRIVREILKYDPIIMELMRKLKDEAAQGLNRISVTKKQQEVYNSQGSFGSFMFDKRN